MDSQDYFNKAGYQRKWKHLAISSFDYLMLINKYSSRSFNDTSQYPIFPWIGPCGWDTFSEINNLDIDIATFSKEDEKSKQYLPSKEEHYSEHGLVRNLYKNWGKYEDLVVITFIL